MCFVAHLVLYKVYWKFPISGIRATITVRLLWFKALFDMYYIWILLFIWTLILFWGETILINKIVKPLNLCVMAIKFFSSLELIKGLCIWFTGLYNFFLFVSHLLAYYSIWDKSSTYLVLAFSTWHNFIYIYFLFIWVTNKTMVICLIWIIYYFLANCFFYETVINW